MVKTTSRSASRQLLDRLTELDRQTTKAYYEMGSLLSAIQHGRLWDRLGYDSMGGLIDKNLSFGRSTAYGYMNMYRHFQRLGYSKFEALSLLSEFGLSYLQRFLASVDQKLGIRATRNRIEQLRSEKKELTFWIPANKQAKVIRVLREHGCTVHETGYLGGSSQAFLNLVDSAAKKSA